jgi:hypothetical protein
MKVRQIKENIDAVEGYRSRRDAYQRDYDSSVSGMGRRQSQAYQDDGGANDERHDLDPSDWYIVRDGKMFKLSVYPNQEQEAMSRGYSRTRDEARAKAADQDVSEMDAPGQIMNATGDKVTIDNKDGTQTIAPKASLTRDPTGKGFVLSKTPTAGGEKPDEPKPGETVFKPATTEGTEKMNEAIRILRLAGLHKAADKLMEQQLFENPWEGKDPKKAGAWAQLSPEDQKWLGGADPTDPAILARAPKKGKASAAAVGANQDADDAAMGAAMTANAAAAPAAAPTQAASPAAPAVSNPQNPGGMSDEEMLARQQTTGAAATSAATGVGNPGEEAAAQAAADKTQATAGAPGAQDDATGVDAAVAAQAAAPAASPTQAASPAKPAAPAANKSMTPAVTAYASRLGLLKNNKPDVDAIKKFQQSNGLKADGVIGPNTAGAIISASGSNMGGGGGGPAAPRPGANQPAPYNAAKDSQAASAAAGQKGAKAPQAASPAAPAKPALPGQISNTPAAEDRQFYEELNKMLTIARLR